MNSLYYGDNLEILRKYVGEESVDLIYLDPPFNSKRAYNVIFRDKTGSDSAAQIQAFEDIWTWTEQTQESFDEIMTGDYSAQLKTMMRAFRDFMGTNNLMAYLTMMAIRLVELRRVLKPTGSIYLHCDPTASHYLKILLDQIFELKNYRNEIIWHYRKWPTGKYQFQRNHDVIFFYTKSSENIHSFNQLFMERASSTIRRFGKLKIISGHKENGSRIPSITAESESMGVRKDDVWNIGRVPPIKQLFPTEKPHDLISRMIKASSNEGDVVLDPFCGCGTAIAAAEKLGRKWIGIDVTHLAIALIKNRISNHFPDAQFEIIGEPKSGYDAQRLFEQSPFQFEAWAVSLLGGQPFKSKGGGDRGVDGLIFFEDGQSNFHKIIIEAKGGKYQPKNLRSLKAVLEREKAPLGILIALQPPTKGMLSDAAALGKWQMPGVELQFPVLQVITIQEIFDGKRPEIPQWHETLKKATRERRGAG